MAAEEVRISEADFQRLMKGVKASVREELEGIGLLTADPEERIKTILAIEFLKSLHSGARVAQTAIGKRLINGFCWLLGASLVFFAGWLTGVGK
jgi:hypothetical protein